MRCEIWEWVGGGHGNMDGRHIKGRGQCVWKGCEENAEALSG